VLFAIVSLFLIVISILKLKFKNEKIIRNEVIRKMIIICFCIGLAFFIIIEGLIVSSYGKGKQPEKDAACVVVLGCGIFPDGTLTLSLQKRLNVAFDYLIDNPDTVCIVSGGQGENEPFSEASAMSGYLIEKGIDDQRIILENKSTSTSENLLYSDKIIKQLALDGDIAVATSDFHMFRTQFLAKRYGMGKIITLPSSTSWYLWVTVHLREFMAVLKSFFLD